MDSLLEFEKKIGYEFKDKNLLKQALTHSSYANEQHMKKHSDNERLEFLGDAVLEIVSSEFLYLNYPNLPEGQLTKLRASLVCEPTLAYCTEEIDLGKYLYLSHGEDKTGGRKRPSVLSDAFEATIGAIYLDGGMAPAKEYILKYILSDIEEKRLFHDSKTSLQEIIQSKHQEALSYVLISESGPDHDKKFEVAAMLGDKRLGSGIGRSKKLAEQNAAYNALLALKNKEN